MTLKVKIDPRITEIVERLQSAGFEAYIVGGAVRDLLLDRKPKDYDISTAATPEQIRAVFRDRRTLIIGRRFRLVHLFLGHDIIEISTFRRRPDPAAQADRPPRAADAPELMIFNDNEFGTAEDDAHRRDFTVNALFYDPVHDRIADFTAQGMNDLRDGIVRIIGEPYLRFEEDPVRLLRALKLIGQYGFRLEERTGQALREALPLIVHASASRLTLELEKILKNPYGSNIIRTFHEYGFLALFLPNFEKFYDTPQLRYAMELWSRRDERLREGLFRDSLSLVLALSTLPFFEEERGGLWEYREGMETDFSERMHRLFYPMTLTRRAVAAAIRNLMAQRRLKEADPHAVRSSSYATARELAVIQNELQWHIPDLESRLPAVSFAPNSFRKRRRPHRRRRPHPDAG